MLAVHLNIGDVVLKDGWDVDLQCGIVSIGVAGSDLERCDERREHVMRRV